MAAASDQSSDLFTQLLEQFSSNPAISIEQTTGDSPDQFEITYNISGMSINSDDLIVKSDSHKIELTIPFGFPHFPPSCKPKSNIFHPDFDPAAICLGEFWEQGRTIPELIIFIGRMINGEIYSTANAFNEDAATWYNNHNADFPLEQISWEGDRPSSVDMAMAEPQIDTLGDADLSSDFDYLSLDESNDKEDIALDTSYAQPDSPADVDTDLLRFLAGKKNYNKLLENLGENQDLTPEILAFSKEAKQALKKARTLHAAAQKNEDQGVPQKALENYRRVQQVVADYPDIESDIERAEHTLNLLGGFTEKKEPPPTPKTAPRKKPEAKATTESPEKKESPSRRRRDVSPDDYFFDDHKSSKAPLYILIALVLVVAATGGYFYFSFTSNLAKAKLGYEQCQAALEKNAFIAAEQSCKNALRALDTVKFVSKQEVNQLKTALKTTLKSKKLAQGLIGNILVDGHYYAQDDAQHLFNLKKSLKDAGVLYEQDQWQQALKSYKALLPRALKSKLVKKSILDTIRERINQSQFRLEYDRAVEFYNDSEWGKAADGFAKAKQTLKKLVQTDQLKFKGQLNIYLTRSLFEKSRVAGDNYYSKSDWKNAVAAYKQALKSGKGKDFTSPDTTKELQEKIKKAELYSKINHGNKSFASGAWRQAIKAYKEAGSFLEKNDSTLSEEEAAISKTKLNRIILKTSIIKEKQAIKDKMATYKYKGAGKACKKILAIIEDSPFAAEQEFITTRNEIRKSLRKINRKILIRSKKNYLTKNYKRLFTLNYPTTSADTLSHPSINLLKEKGGDLIFKLQCIETTGGRPLTLVMYYAYNTASGQWRFYSRAQ